ncbi:MAG: outer membrane protein assembly factor BamD [Cyclobacteriaceae bacterium]
MRKMSHFSVFLTVLALVLMASCSEFRKIQKSTDWKQKYDAAMAYYENEDYYKAGLLLEDIIPIIRGTKEAEKANFIHAYTYYHQRQYLLSANYFQNFAVVYSRSDYAEEASYMQAYSLYLQSPDTNLDQTSTYEAITAFQNFINSHPRGEYADKVNEIMDEMQHKLELKAFENAKQYHKLRRYEAALIAFENFSKDFPDSRLNEEALYLSVDTQYNFAKQSIYTKQKERYSQTVEMYEELIDNYPQSEFLKRAENMYSNSLDEIKKLTEKK